MEAHTHGPDCYSEDGLLICPLPQHTHTADCYEQLEEQTPLCGLNEHTHTESCYDADGTLLCTLPEHTHTDSCYLPQEPAKQDFSYDDAQLHLRVTVESPQPLPEGTALARADGGRRQHASVCVRIERRGAVDRPGRSD